MAATHGWGARRWIDLAVFQFQPSEFAKLAFILAQAHFLSRPVEELRAPGNFWKPIGLMMLPFLLIMKEPDLGSALVLLPTGSGDDVRGRHAAGVICCGWSAAVGLLAALFLVDVLFAPPLKWQISNSRIISGSGCWFISAQAIRCRPVRRRQSRNADAANCSSKSHIPGATGVDFRRLGRADWAKAGGRARKLPWVFCRRARRTMISFSPSLPRRKDSSAAWLCSRCMRVVLFTGIRIAGQARDRLGKLLAVGVVTLLFSHVFINIGMNIRIVPVTGVPLPLLSYGGSSVLGSLIAMGLLQNVYIYRKAY